MRATGVEPFGDQVHKTIAIFVERQQRPSLGGGKAPLFLVRQAFPSYFGDAHGIKTALTQFGRQSAPNMLIQVESDKGRRLRVVAHDPPPLASDLAVVPGKSHPFSQSFAKGFFGILGNLTINLDTMT
jgi:hypothetical protein